MVEPLLTKDSQPLVLVPAAVLDELLTRTRHIDAELRRFAAERDAVGKPEMLSMGEVCELLRCRRSVVWGLMRRGQLPYGQRPSQAGSRAHYLFRRSEVERVVGLLASSAPAPAEAVPA
jgi:predicted DNA-binding transcriptional regulator AlpA